MVKRRKNKRATVEFRNINSDPKIIELCRYMKHHGWLNETKLAVGSTTSDHRGIYTNSTEIPAGNIMISIPLRTLISWVTIEMDAEFKQLLFPQLSLKNVKISVHCLLAVYLLYLKHNNSHMPYIDTLPTEFSNVIFSPKSELLLLPDSVFDQILMQDNEIKVGYNAITSLFTDTVCSCCGKLFIDDIFHIDSFKWSYFVVNSRSVYIDPNVLRELAVTTDFLDILTDEPNTALAPFLDLFNHSDKVSTVSELSTPISLDSMYQLYTKTAIDKNSNEIFINYGALDNTKLLLDYGFFIVNNSNDLISFTIDELSEFAKIHLKSSQLNIANRFRFIKTNGIDQQLFCSRSDGLSHNLIVCLTILFSPTLNVSFDNVLSKVAFSDTPDIEPIKNVAIDFIRSKCNCFTVSRDEFIKLQNDLVLSKCGSIVLGYLDECINLLNDVIVEYLS